MTLATVERTLLFLVLLFLPTQLGRHFWPQFSFIYSLPVDYLSPTIYFWDLVTVCLFAVWMLGKPQVNKLALNLFLFFILTQAVSLVETANFGAGLVRLEQYLVTGLFGVYVSSLKFKAQSEKLYWPLTLTVLVESVLAILQFIKAGTLGFWILGERTFTISTPAIAKFDFYGREFLRPYGTFPHPNVLAAFMVVVSLLLTVIRPRVSGLFVKAAFILGGLSVILAMSRTAIFTGGVAAIILLRRKWLIFIAIIIFILSPVFFTRFSTVFSFDSLSFIRREELSAVSLNLWLSSPVLGAGLNNFIPAASNELLSGPSRFLQPVHNIFLLALAETGILGMLGLLGLIGYPIWRLIKLYPKPYPLNPILMIWGIIIFLGLFDHYFLTLPQGYRLLFLIWGMSLSSLFKNDNI